MTKNNISKLYKKITEKDFNDLNVEEDEYIKKHEIVNSNKDYIELMLYFLSKRDYLNKIGKEKEKELVGKIFEPLNKEEKLKSIEILFQAKWDKYIYIKEDTGLTSPLWNVINKKKYKIVNGGDKISSYEVIRNVNEEIIKEVSIPEDLIDLNIENFLINNSIIDKINQDNFKDVWDKETIEIKRKEYIRKFTDKYIVREMGLSNMTNNTFISQMIIGCVKESDSENQLNKIKIINKIIKEEYDTAPSEGINKTVFFLNSLLLNSEFFEFFENVKEENKKYLNKNVLSIIDKKNIPINYGKINPIEKSINNETYILYKMDINEIMKKNKKILLQKKKMLFNVEWVIFLKEELKDYEDIKVVDLNNYEEHADGSISIRDSDYEDMRGNIKLGIYLKKDKYESISNNIKELLIESFLEKINGEVDSKNQIANKLEKLIMSTIIEKTTKSSKKIKF